MIKSWGSDSKLIVKPEEEFKEVLNLKINSEKANKNLHWEATRYSRNSKTRLSNGRNIIINNSFEYCLKKLKNT